MKVLRSGQGWQIIKRAVPNPSRDWERLWRRRMNGQTYRLKWPLCDPRGKWQGTHKEVKFYMKFPFSPLISLSVPRYRSLALGRNIPGFSNFRHFLFKANFPYVSSTWRQPRRHCLHLRAISGIRKAIWPLLSGFWRCRRVLGGVATGFSEDASKRVSGGKCQKSGWRGEKFWRNCKRILRIHMNVPQCDAVAVQRQVSECEVGKEWADKLVHRPPSAAKGPPRCSENDLRKGFFFRPFMRFNIYANAGA